MRNLVVLLLAAALLTLPIQAYTVEEMWAEFDATSLTYDEKRFLQTSLAFSGHYSALLDGAWGAGSQRSLEEWVSRNDFSLPVENWEVVLLAVENLARFDEDGWEQRYFEPLDMSFLVPGGKLRPEAPSGSFLNYAHTATSLRYSLTLGGLPEVTQIHDYALRSALAVSTPYTLRRDAVRITAVDQPEGLKLYVRSDLRRDGWSTIVLSAAARDESLLGAVSASIAKGSSAPIDLPANGKLLLGLGSLETILEESDEALSNNDADRIGDAMTGPPAIAAAPAPPQQPAAAPASPAAPSSSAEPRLTGSGTAFYVSSSGHMLTNAHVVADCQNLRVGERVVSLVAEDSSFDLALLKDQATEPPRVATFASRPAPLNADITIAGYPLAGMLAGLNVTRGSVTALRGLRGDATTMQISAPVQPGNSGGPAVDELGAVVGVVVSKLDAKALADATGDIPQNINFAIRGEIAKLFMFQHGVEPVLVENDSEQLNPVEAARRLDEMTRMVECYS